jgi:ribosomal protein S18 acetylase RimI-like enzyme
VGELAQAEGLAAHERAEAIRLLAEAFADNPLNVAVIGGSRSTRVRSNAAGIRAVLPTAERCGHVRVARDGGVPCGVLIAAPPGAYPFPRPSAPALLRSLVGQGLRVAGRWREAFEALDAVHPRDPRWYLSLLGVAPARQGRGFGGALLDAWLARVDDDGLPAWLETDREANLAFYGARGFGVEHELRVLGARVWCLGRPARAPAPEIAGLR